MAKLAIVIPAYKIVYFQKVLESISNQTCKDFTVYIGVDGSTEDFSSIIKSYSDKISIIYTHFNKNIGKKNLVSHWERCINLVKDEEWIWLFSDDDIMESTCVEDFYKSLNENREYNLFHFNISQINEHNDVIKICEPFPSVLNCEDFLVYRLKGILSSYASEYIFRKEYFIAHKRFQNFDLAWGSDDATWIKLAKKNGIKTIKDSKVYWRKSPFNISPNKRNQNLVSRKLYSQIQFSKWIIEMASRKEVNIELHILKNLLEYWFLASVKQSVHFFSFKKLHSISKDFHITIEKQKRYTLKTILLYNYKVYRWIIDLFKGYFIKEIL
jgi:glycosyltransferase involved in cell wall biosynthesis